MLCKKSIVNNNEILLERKVYAAFKSANRLEFYQADKSGYKIDKIMTVRTFEYHGEEVLKVDEEVFTILRSYDRKDGTIELILIREIRLYDEDALLTWKILESEEVVEKTLEVKVRCDTTSNDMFNASYQLGTATTYTFKLKNTDFDLTKHLEIDTNKPLYATTIQYDGANYNILKTFRKKSINEIDLVCS
jgi:hypothetical protein